MGYKILVEAEDSVLLQYKREFDGYGITLNAEEAGLRRIAELAVSEKTGARSLVTILEQKLRNFKFELPSTACAELKLTRELVENPDEVLRKLSQVPSRI